MVSTKTMLGFVLTGIMFGIPIGVVLCDKSHALTRDEFWKIEGIDQDTKRREAERQLEQERWQHSRRQEPC